MADVGFLSTLVKSLIREEEERREAVGLLLDLSELSEVTMAVTKGKALVQQKDSLKQSLAKKTSELEKCLVELQEKSSALEAA